MGAIFGCSYEHKLIPGTGVVFHIDVGHAASRSKASPGACNLFYNLIHFLCYKQMTACLLKVIVFSNCSSNVY